MSARKKEPRQGTSCELYHTNLSFQEDLQPSVGPSGSPYPSQPCPLRRIRSCFGLPNPDGSYTYSRDYSVPEGSPHPNNICRSCIQKKSQDGLYNYLRACEKKSGIDDDDAPRTRIPKVNPDAFRDMNDERHSQNQIQDDVHFPLRIRSDQRRKNHRISQNNERENVPPQPSCSSSNNPDCPPMNPFYNSFDDQINRSTEIHRLHERIDLLENNILGNVDTTAYCLCSCHNSTRPMTPPPENSWQRNEPRLFPDPRDDWDESAEPGFPTPIV
ncbi:uncharacterized protein EAF01_011681 [Botrytis porri]|uniref:uncharacterized protein n=1 Tax=Botrytis porri TaxID=87229 RepID=UPI001900F020|nr:uncharacterized protein EAF01_011681 [Botrytis porri]KAF7883172.1 hypothetical protein EAF01_011681 [Botrytis porri]